LELPAASGLSHCKAWPHSHRHGHSRQIRHESHALAFGTGSNNGYVQAALGQKEFTRLIHYAYDRGIRFFETAEAYATPAMLAKRSKACLERAIN